MADVPLHTILGRIRQARALDESTGLSDGQLLERFVAARDEAAFEALVWRHGPAVLALCRRVLPCPADAEDVFQATFLTLARRGMSIRTQEALAAWLHRVAYRIAVRLRATRARWARREQTGVEAVTDYRSGPALDADLRGVVDDEVNRLPAKYRAAVVLCYLQGLTTQEAGRALGCPQGTILSRLAWARQRLRDRLVRRGLAPAAALALVETVQAAVAAPPVELVASVVRAALPFAAGGAAAAGVVSAQVAALAQGALRTMFLGKIKVALVIILAVGMAGAGTGWLARGTAGDPTADAPAKPLPAKPGSDRAALIERARKSLQGIEHAAEDMEAVLTRQLIDVRERLVEAEERLREARRQPLETPVEVEKRLLKEEAADVELTIGKLKRAAKPEDERLRKFLRQLDSIRSELARIDRSANAAREKRFGAIVQLRKQIVQDEERVRQLERKQAIMRERFARKWDEAADRLRRLEDRGPAALGGDPALRKLERKLDALQRDLTELRRAVRRLRMEQD